LALLGHSTVELGGRSGNLAWHAPANDYRKTKFPCRKTRIAGISQSKFVPTVANDLRRKMRGWMRLGASRLTSSFHFFRQHSPFARQKPLHRTRILPKPRRLRRFSISDSRFALFNIKRDIAVRLLQIAHERSCLAAVKLLATVSVRPFVKNIPTWRLHDEQLFPKSSFYA
jgi:hypothetical protein